MALLTGFMTSLAWIGNDQKNLRLKYLDPELRSRYSEGTLDLGKDNETLRNEMTMLRDENTKFQNAVAKNSNASASLNKSLQEQKLFSALTEVEGPGVVVKLKDVLIRGPDQAASMVQIIHDTDVVLVVNELKNTGAEAISVNNRRVGPNTNFRCVGTTILVDEVKIASPVIIRAIGDSDTLFGGMNLPGGILDKIRETDANMIEIEPVQKMRIPAFSGAMSFKFAKVPEDKK